MATAEAPPAADLWKQNYGVIPLWLTRSDQLTHAQFHILVVLIIVLGGRKGWWHTSYRRIAELACTDTQTVTTAMNKFVEAEWVLVKGSNWRQYKLNRAAIEGVYRDYEDEEDEEE